MRSEAEIACAVGKDTIDATPRALNFDGGHRRDAVPGTAPARWREGRRSSRDLVLGPTPARWRGSWRRLASSRSPLDATQVFCAGSPCDGISGNNRYRKASIVDHPTSGLVSFVGEWYEKLTARAEQQDEPFITILENVGSMFLSVREELNDVLRQDVNRYVVDEMLFGGAPRKRYFWTNVLCQCIDQVSTRPSRFTQAPVEKLEQEAVKLQSVVGVLKAAASEAVPVVPNQVLATVVTKNCRGGVGRDPTAWARPTIWDYDRVKKDSNTGNWVRLSASSDVIRLFSVSECAVALNLPPNFVSCGASETDQRGLLGRAFGPCSIAHLLKCLEGIFDE